MTRVFVLSPANCNGLRARRLLQRNGSGELARRLRADGAPLGEVFSFVSALYFRGKLAYASAFAAPPRKVPGVWIITPSAGLVPQETIVHAAALRGFGRGRIDLKSNGYCSALRRTAKKLALETGSDCPVIFLGSLATRKYLDILAPMFGDRLLIPEEFIGRGDMSRGGLLLRCVREMQELRYIAAPSSGVIGGTRNPAPRLPGAQRGAGLP